MDPHEAAPQEPSDDSSRQPLSTHVTRTIKISPMTVRVRPRVRIYARASVVAFPDEEGDDE